MATIIVKQVRSRIGASKDQKASLDTLGLRRMNQQVEHNDTPQIRGIIRKLHHMVQVVESQNN
ncbi:ribosomal protein L30 [Bacteroidales bacterium KA00251]|nr:ribosomal protein L30 [Bacteroidales bacterium KA00251]